MTAPQSVVTEQPGRRRWRARVLAVLAIFGPGLFAADAGIDAGSFVEFCEMR